MSEGFVLQGQTSLRFYHLVCLKKAVELEAGGYPKSKPSKTSLAKREFDLPMHTKTADLLDRLDIELKNVIETRAREIALAVDAALAAQTAEVDVERMPEHVE